MPTKIIQTANGQTVYDIAIQHYGSIEHIDKVMEDVNVTSLTQEFGPGVEITLRDVEANSINDFFSDKRPVATAVVAFAGLFGDEGSESFLLTGDGGQILFGDF